MLEREVLLRACGPRGRAELEPLLSQPVDWRLLLEQAANNGVTPQLCLALKDHSCVPEAIHAELLESWVRNAAHSLRLTNALLEVLGDLRERGVAALAYKGPALAMLAYGNVAMRCFGDLDIIVRRADVAAAKSALEGMGYPCTLSRERQAYCLRERYHLHFAGGDPPRNLEIHWAITPVYWPFRLDAARLWSGAASVELMGVPIPTLDRELTLLAICAHGAKERWPRLSLICDLAGLVARSPDLDWGWITRQAAAMGRTRVLLLGLRLAASLLDAPIPDFLLAQAQADHVVVTVAREIEDSLLLSDPLEGLRFHRYAWRVWNRWLDRLGYLRYAMAALPGKLVKVLRPTEVDGSLPAGLSWLWRPVRAVWQSRDDLRRILRRIANNL